MMMMIIIMTSNRPNRCLRKGNFEIETGTWNVVVEWVAPLLHTQEVASFHILASSLFTSHSTSYGLSY
jgi:hypothetical protein